MLTAHRRRQLKEELAPYKSIIIHLEQERGRIIDKRLKTRADYAEAIQNIKSEKERFLAMIGKLPLPRDAYLWIFDDLIAEPFNLAADIVARLDSGEITEADLSAAYRRPKGAPEPICKPASNFYNAGPASKRLAQIIKSLPSAEKFAEAYGYPIERDVAARRFNLGKEAAQNLWSWKDLSLEELASRIRDKQTPPPLNKEGETEKGARPSTAAPSSELDARSEEVWLERFAQIIYRYPEPKRYQDATKIPLENDIYRKHFDLSIEELCVVWTAHGHASVSNMPQEVARKIEEVRRLREWKAAQAAKQKETKAPASEEAAKQTTNNPAPATPQEEVKKEVTMETTNEISLFDAMKELVKLKASLGEIAQKMIAWTEDMKGAPPDLAHAIEQIERAQKLREIIRSQA